MLRIRHFIIILLLSNSLLAQQSRIMCDFIVAQDGTGNFQTIQEALDAVPDLRGEQTVIYIKNGIYKEKLYLFPTKIKVKLVGESIDKTIITYDDFAQKKTRFGEDTGTSGSSAIFLYGNDFIAENITFENTAGPVGQAVAARIDGDRAIFKNCRFLGFQDTLFPHGEKSRQYY